MIFSLKLNKQHRSDNLMASIGREDVTVIIGVKNRLDYRITNALKSLRNQTYDQNLIKIILVDYNSNKKLIRKYKKICKKYNTDYVRVSNQPVWSRSHCLNIAIKRTKTKYILTSDVDIIFEKNYIKTVIKKLQIKPYRVIVCKMLDSAKDDINKHTDIIKNYEALKTKAKFRTKKGGELFFGKSINATLTYFYHKC